ncbi:hypothetical protein Gotri_021005, partial [Gossypium trilobum]|nr:hypothetical protein [Gossypium trilobum]
MILKSSLTTLQEGHYTMCPTLLNEENHSNWKVKMKFFIQAFDYGAWKIISRGLLETPKEEERWDANDKAKTQSNSKAMHTLFCAMSEEDFNKKPCEKDYSTNGNKIEDEQSSEKHPTNPKNRPVGLVVKQSVSVLEGGGLNIYEGKRELFLLGLETLRRLWIPIGAEEVQFRYCAFK